MIIKEIRQALTFDDVMLVPIKTSVQSRKSPCTKTVVGNELEIPIIAAPMNTITEKAMCETMIGMGADAVLHRYMSIDEQVKMFDEIKTPYKPWVAIGASGDYVERATTLYRFGARKFCIDVANGHSEQCINATRKIRDITANTWIMAGNVCSGEGAGNLEEAGANVIRAGVGSGSCCKTRLVTGFGVPQISAIQWCKEGLKNKETLLVSDGGIRFAGDIVKAIGAGADAVMIGGMLSGTDQCPGETLRDQESGRLYKYCAGMASEAGRRQYFKDDDEISFVPEGESYKVWHKGDAKKIIQNLNDSLKVGMSFANALSIKELQDNAEWVQVTTNGHIEGTPNRKMFK